MLTVRRLVDYFSKRKSDVDLVLSFFDEVYYLENYPQVRTFGISPFDHFMQHGWKEGKNPSARFNVAFYLEKNADVREAAMNPLIHYVKYGMREGRKPNPSVVEPGALPPAVETAYSHEVLALVEELFDRKYYLAMYDDVRKSGLNPLLHYMNNGWREFRNPSSNFNTATYLELNKDVKASGMNPLLHYAQAGRFEDRIIRLDCLEELAVLEAKHGSMARAGKNTRASFEAKPIAILQAAFAKIGRNMLAVAVSHDNYLEQPGGVQAVMREEERKLTTLGFCYVHLAPIYNECTPSLTRDYVRVALDGEGLGVFRLSGVEDLIRMLIAKQTTDRILIIHSLVNFDEEFIAQRLLSIEWSRKYYWVHDYSVLCSEANLLRNGVTFCGCPPAESVACFTCSGYASRARKERLLSFYREQGLVFLAPSTLARHVFLQGGKAEYNVRVVNHRSLISTEAVHKKLRGPSDQLRVAFCGYPVFHKGWGVFELLVERSMQTGQYRFFHLGARQRLLNGVEFVEVASATGAEDRMAEALRLHEIDVVVIASQWPETFCLVAYEAILAGAMVATTDVSGNVATLADSYSQVLKFPSNKALIEGFASGEVARITRQTLETGVPVFRAERNGTTAAVEV